VPEAAGTRAHEVVSSANGFDAENPPPATTKREERAAELGSDSMSASSSAMDGVVSQDQGIAKVLEGHGVLGKPRLAHEVVMLPTAMTRWIVFELVRPRTKAGARRHGLILRSIDSTSLV